MQKYVTRELRKEEDGRTTSSSWEIVYLASEADAEIAKLREALQWFADPRNYEDTPERVAYLKSNIVWREGIDRAKKALGL